VFLSRAPELGYYKVLRTQIVQRCKANNWNTIMITSAVPGEGKTLTAINLAAHLCKSLRPDRPSGGLRPPAPEHPQYLGIPSPMGLADYLQNGTPLKDLIMWPGVEKFTSSRAGTRSATAPS
jgi:protein-tyrosine kinase